MRWRKLGVVWNTEGVHWWSQTHAMGPTPFLRDEATIRVFLTTLDAHGRGRPMYVDVSSAEPTRVLNVSDSFLMDLGRPGTFDDNGVMPISFVNSGETLRMYYAGFELCTRIRYRIFAGLAQSHDGGESFHRVQETPILDRTQQELYFRGGPYALVEDGRTKLWYVGGSAWTDLNGKAMPVYDLRYQESDDGVHWAAQGQVSMALTHEDEHGFGRPWVVRNPSGDYELFYSIRRRSLAAYRLGYARSRDGVRWQRMDSAMGLDISPGEFDSDAIMYSAVIDVRGRRYCFYNGNEFGRTGFGVAELIDA